MRGRGTAEAVLRQTRCTEVRIVTVRRVDRHLPPAVTAEHRDERSENSTSPTEGSGRPRTEAAPPAYTVRLSTLGNGPGPSSESVFETR